MKQQSNCCMAYWTFQSAIVDRHLTHIPSKSDTQHIEKTINNNIFIFTICHQFSFSDDLQNSCFPLLHQEVKYLFCHLIINHHTSMIMFSQQLNVTLPPQEQNLYHTLLTYGVWCARLFQQFKITEIYERSNFELAKNSP